MKPYELYSIWTQFEAMMESSLPTESKLNMGAEWIRSLPPKQLCVSATLSYEVVHSTMKGRLTDLKYEYERNRDATDGASGGPEEKIQTQEDVSRPIQTQGNDRPSQEPLRKNAANRGRKKAVENLD